MEPAVNQQEFQGENAQQLMRIMAMVNDLAVLPHVVFKVLELSSSTDNPTYILERAITVDPGFSARVLSLANSAAMGLPRRVSSIKDAITFLGFKNVRQLAMTIGVFDLFGGKQDKDSLRRRNWWRHSVDSAVCGRYIADQTKIISGDEAYTCGLLHNVGKSILDKCKVADYIEVEDKVKNGAFVLDAELEIFGCDHQQVAVCAARKWRLPELLISGLEYLTPASPKEPFSEYKATTALGSILAKQAPNGFDEDQLEYQVPTWILASLNLDGNRLWKLANGCSEHLKQANVDV